MHKKQNITTEEENYTREKKIKYQNIEIYKAKKQKKI